MKRFLLLLMVYSLCVLGYPALTDFNIDWCNVTGGFSGSPSCATYNYATSHFLICDYSAKTVRIASGTDGSLTGGTLSTTGLNFTGGSLGVFAICATSDGVIYGGVDGTTVGTAGVSLARWDNELATPTQQDPAQTAGVLEFPRAMDAIGTGNDTILAVCGSNTYNASILTTTNGTIFAITDYITGGTNGFKQGVALVEGMEKIYGLRADGGGQVVRFDKIGGVWTENTSPFTPPDSYTAPPTGLGAACMIGFAKGHNAIFVIGNSDATNDYMSLLDGDTGTIIAQKQVGQDVGTYGYGCVDLKETDGIGYFSGRSGTASSAIMGKISFTPYVPPTPTSTPTPTPIILSVKPGWGLYE